MDWRRKEVYWNVATVVATTCPTLKGRRREEICFIAVAVTTATCPTLKGRRREEICFMAVAVATATCRGYTIPRASEPAPFERRETFPSSEQRPLAT